MGLVNNCKTCAFRSEHQFANGMTDCYGRHSNRRVSLGFVCGDYLRATPTKALRKPGSWGRWAIPPRRHTASQPDERTLEGMLARCFNYVGVRAR